MSFYDLHGLPLMQLTMFLLAFMGFVISPLNVWILVQEKRSVVREWVYSLNVLLFTAISILVIVIFITNR